VKILDNDHICFIEKSSVVNINFSIFQISTKSIIKQLAISADDLKPAHSKGVYLSLNHGMIQNLLVRDFIVMRKNLIIIEPMKDYYPLIINLESSSQKIIKIIGVEKIYQLNHRLVILSKHVDFAQEVGPLFILYDVDSEKTISLRSLRFTMRIDDIKSLEGSYIAACSVDTAMMIVDIEHDRVIKILNWRREEHDILDTDICYDPLSMALFGFRRGLTRDYIYYWNLEDGFLNEKLTIKQIQKFFPDSNFGLNTRYLVIGAIDQLVAFDLKSTLEQTWELENFYPVPENSDITIGNSVAKATHAFKTLQMDNDNILLMTTYFLQYDLLIKVRNSALENAQKSILYQIHQHETGIDRLNIPRLLVKPEPQAKTEIYIPSNYIPLKIKVDKENDYYVLGLGYKG
jgi:hypothetical protein